WGRVSQRPGRTALPRASIRMAPAGTAIASRAPTAAMRPFSTTIVASMIGGLPAYQQKGFGFTSVASLNDLVLRLAACQLTPYSEPPVFTDRGPGVFARMGATRFRVIGDHLLSPDWGPGVYA